MDILLESNTILEFIEYYNSKPTFENFEKIDLNKMKYILEKFYDDIGIPIYNKISKHSSKKKREIYYFVGDESIYLKYVNFVMTRKLDLGIHKNCHSFQKGRTCGKIINKIRRYNLNNLCAVKADISDYFNSVPVKDENEELCIDSWIPESIKAQPRIYNLICNILYNDDVLYRGQVIKKYKKGIMAGLPIAGTLSNLYLKDFDVEMSHKYIKYFRYSDDVMILCGSDMAEDVEIDLRNSIRKYGLIINEDKTEIFDKGEAFDYLGVNISSHTVDLSFHTKQKMKRRIKRKTYNVYRWSLTKEYKIKPLSLAKPVVRAFNYKFYGKDEEYFITCGESDADNNDFTWGKYFFDIITTDKSLREIDKYFQDTLRYLVNGRHCKKDFKHMKYDELKSIGYIPLVYAYHKRKKNLLNANYK